MNFEQVEGSAVTDFFMNIPRLVIGRPLISQDGKLTPVNDHTHLARSNNFPSPQPLPGYYYEKLRDALALANVDSAKPGHLWGRTFGFCPMHVRDEYYCLLAVNDKLTLAEPTPEQNVRTFLQTTFYAIAPHELSGPLLKFLLNQERGNFPSSNQEIAELQIPNLPKLVQLDSRQVTDVFDSLAWLRSGQLIQLSGTEFRLEQFVGYIGAVLDALPPWLRWKCAVSFGQYFPSSQLEIIIRHTLSGPANFSNVNLEYWPSEIGIESAAVAPGRNESPEDAFRTPSGLKWDAHPPDWSWKKSIEAWNCELQGDSRKKPSKLAGYIKEIAGKFPDRFWPGQCEADPATLKVKLTGPLQGVQNVSPSGGIPTQEGDHHAGKTPHDHIASLAIESRAIHQKQGLDESSANKEGDTLSAKTSELSFNPSWENQPINHLGSSPSRSVGAGRSSLINFFQSVNWHSRLFSRFQKDILVMGPENSGKSSMAVGLCRVLVIERDFLALHGIDLMESPESELQDSTLFSLNDVLKHGQTTVKSATDRKMESFQFECTIRRNYRSLVDERWRLQIPNFKGFDGFSNTQQMEIHPEIINLAKQSSRIIYCVDANDPQKAAARFNKHFLLLIAQRIKLKEIVFALTKADEYFAGEAKPLESCHTADPRLRLEKILGMRVLDLATNICSRSNISVIWTSVYGFLSNGAANFDSQKRRMLSCEDAGTDHESAKKDWRPFQILDACIYFTSGYSAKLVPVFGDR